VLESRTHRWSALGTVYYNSFYYIYVTDASRKLYDYGPEAWLLQGYACQQAIYAKYFNNKTTLDSADVWICRPDIR